MKISKKKNLERIHNIFLNSIKEHILGEVLLGSLVYAREKDLTCNSDLDLVCIVDKKNLNNFLNSKYIKGSMDFEVAINALENGFGDYLVLKIKIKDTLLSVDVLTPNFFKKMCNLKLKEQNSSFISRKYGNEPQKGNYYVKEFNGKIHEMSKKNKKIKFGNSIELPLFFISKKGNYIYGIPTIKYITHKIFYDPQKIIEKGINNLYKNLIERLIFEYPLFNLDQYKDYFLNLLKGRKKFTEDYREKLLSKVTYFITMNQEDEIFNSIKKEVYNLFHDQTDERRYSYVRRDWIFPNHFEIMVELVEDMCDKYGGNKNICKIAVMLHDVGLVYNREGSSSEGHENRSIEYAENILEKYGISSIEKEEIINCIKATDAYENPKSLNPKIVRTSDALSQFISVHFFAKSAFSGDWDSYVEWLNKKSNNNFKKICFKEEQLVAEPIKNYIQNAIKMHKKYSKNYPLKKNF